MIHVPEEQRAVVAVLLRYGDLPPRQPERLEMVIALSLGHDLGTSAQRRAPWKARAWRSVCGCYGLRMLWVEQSYKQVKRVVVATATAVLLIGVAPQ